jgi:AraC-like DNA-binding protein
MKPEREITRTQANASFVSFRGYFATRMWWHYHPEYEILLVLRGAGMQFIGDSVTRFEPGDMVLLGPALPHAWMEDREFHQRKKHAYGLVVQFGRDFLGSEFFAKPELRRVAALLEKAKSGLKIEGEVRDALANDLIGLLEQKGLPRLLTFLSVLEGISERTTPSPFCAPGFRSDFTAKDLDRMDRICAYLHDNCGGTIRLPEVAKRFHIAPRTLARLMKKNTGKTLVEFVNALRVNLACQLLARGEMTISQVSYESGFSDPSYFDRKFREIKGMLPRQFRERYSLRKTAPGAKNSRPTRKG